MMIDMHTHVLPGIDDGPKDWETSLNMLAECTKLGVKKVIATPHFYPWKKNASVAEVKKMCKQAMEKFRERFDSEIEVYSGHEIYYSSESIRKLKAGEILTLADSNYVLIEFSDNELFSVLYRAVREFVENSYIPIIAHAERYKCLYNESNLNTLIEGGALLQVNVETFENGILDQKKRWVKKQLKHKKIDFCASDMHNMSNRPPYSKERLQKVHKLVEPEYMEQLFRENCEKVISNLRL